MRKYNITSDLVQVKSFQPIVYKQYDNGDNLEVELYEDGTKITLIDEIVLAFFQLEDGTVIQKTCSINASGNAVATLDNNILSIGGKLSAEFTVYKDGKETTTRTITITVEKSINRNEAIETIPQWDIVNQVLDLKASDGSAIEEKIIVLNEAVETKFNELSAAAQVDSEVVLARGGEVTLGQRLDKVSSTLADIVLNVKNFGAKGDGVTDDTLAIQNAINSLSLNVMSGAGGKIYLPRTNNFYRITSPINIMNPNVSTNALVSIEGDSGQNTLIKLDNNTAPYLFNYDDGSKLEFVDNCTVTSGSKIVTTTGSFVNIKPDMYITLNGLDVGNKVISVDSPTQITLAFAAIASKSGKARFVKFADTYRHRISIKNLFIQNTKTVTKFSTFHPATALRLNGANTSIVENVRIEDFEKGIEVLNGWFNKYHNVRTNFCNYGLILQDHCFASSINDFVGSSCGSGTSTVSGAVLHIVNCGGITINNLNTEMNRSGIILEGVRGLIVNGGNIETHDYSWSFTIKKLDTIENENENYWSTNIDITGIRFWATRGILFLNGVKHVSFKNHSFNAPQSYSRNTGTCIGASGDSKYMKNINYGDNDYYSGAEPVLHIADRTIVRRTIPSFSENGKKYSINEPYYGTNFKKGDILYRHPSTLGNGTNEKWVCIQDGDGVNDGTAIFRATGQIGYRSNAGTPVSVLTPNFIGEEVLDTTNNIWYKAFGTGNTNWKTLSA